MSEIDFKTLSREMAGREGLGGSTIMLTIIALVGLALVWANWAELDNVTRGEGGSCPRCKTKWFKPPRAA